jgi:hypothetical protein
MCNLQVAKQLRTNELYRGETNTVHIAQLPKKKQRKVNTKNYMF